jgi:hypothetical protein
MSLTPEKLSQNVMRGDMFMKIVRDELARIDEVLLRADKSWGENEVQYELPTMLDIPGMSDADVQRVMYSSIITDLERRGFTVYIMLKNEMNTLFIRWIFEVDGDEKKRMNDVIKSHMMDYKKHKNST